jgi:RIO kinase 1
MSGKEAQVYLVVSEGEERVAKVYKEAQQRTFRHRAVYTEGRRVRNSRDHRAMEKHTRHGRSMDEAAWRSTEVDMIYRLQAAGVRVPVPYHFVDGVLIMELVRGADGGPAPRLGELGLSRDEATWIFERLLAEVVKMLLAGVVHGDLSGFNVLMDAAGPVIIDFPQSVNAALNSGARKLLLRDVDNLQRFLARFSPGWRPRPFAQEMWQLYERGELSAETKLTGQFRDGRGPANVGAVLSLIRDANEDERYRQTGPRWAARGRAPSGRGGRSSPVAGRLGAESASAVPVGASAEVASPAASPRPAVPPPRVGGPPRGGVSGGGGRSPRVAAEGAGAQAPGRTGRPRRRRRGSGPAPQGAGGFPQGSTT